MTGVEILNKYAIHTSQAWVPVVGILAFLVMIVFIVACYIIASTASDTVITVCIVCAILCGITAFTLALIDANTDYLKEYSHTEYKVTIDDSVSMNEFLDKYEILGQEGKIYTVKEKE